MRPFFAIILLFAIVAGGCLKPVEELYPSDPELRTVPVYIVSHGWHAGIAIERDYIKHELPDHPDIPATNYLKFGWGDARYYSDPDAGFWLMMRAAVPPTSSAIQMVGFDMHVRHYFSGSEIVEIKITEKGAEELGRFIHSELKTDADGDIIVYGPGLYTNSIFFEGKRYYFLPRTSNKWTARALRKTGYPISPFYAFTSGNVLQQSKKEGEVIQ